MVMFKHIKGDSHWDMSHMIQVRKRPVLGSSDVQTVHLDGNVQTYKGCSHWVMSHMIQVWKRPVLGSSIVQTVHLDGNVKTYEGW